MKTTILLFAFALYAGLVSGATVTITNSGNTFSPDEVTINYGDVVDFQIGGSHNVVEVSESTWLANGNTALPGFQLPFGGGDLMELTPGIHYYVCQPHAEFGMKGKIIVNPVSAIDEVLVDNIFSLYPNPTSGQFIFQFKDNDSGKLPVALDDIPLSLEIINLAGVRILKIEGIESRESIQFDLASLSDGIYFVRIADSRRSYSKKLVIR